MRIRRKLLAVVTTVAVALTSIVASPIRVSAEPPTTVAWTGAGVATSGPATTTRVVANGLADSAVFAYDNLAPDVGGTGAGGSWEFSTTATTAGTVDVDWLYSGFHAYFQVRVGLEAYVDRGGETVATTTLVTDGPVDCCTAPSGGFEYTGSHTFDVQAGDTFGFRMSGSNGDYNSRLRGRLIVGAPGTVHRGTLVVNGFDAARTDGEWGLTESYLTTTRGYLRDPARFGPAGTSPTDFVIGDGVPAASAPTLIGTDVFVTGWVPTGSYSTDEKQALVDFVRAGGSLVATTDDTGHTMVDAFGLGQADGTTNPSTFLDASHPIADGPFGTDDQFVEYATVGSYLTLGPDAVPVAIDAAGNTTLAEITPGTLAPGSGLALFLSDVDFFTDTTAGPGYTGAQDNAILISNLFAYLADPDTAPPPPEAGRARLFQAVPALDGSPRAAIAARVDGPAGSTQQLSLVTSDSCVGGLLGPAAGVGTLSVAVGPSGEQTAVQDVTLTGPLGHYAALRVDGPAEGATSDCVVAGPANDSWIRALPIPLTPTGDGAAGTASGYLDSFGNSRWYRFDVRPGSRVRVDLTSLPADYDLALFTDIAQAFTDVQDVDDLNQLGAEFAPSVFSPSVFSPSVFSPSVFSPDAYAPSVFSPSVFSPSVFSPSVFSPSVFSPSVFSPSVFSPSVFSPSVFSPSVFSPSVFSPSVFSPSVFSPENFASAQSRSLIAVAAQPGNGDEFVVADTWSNTGQFYVRVTGKNGEFDVADPFDLAVSVDGVDCANVAPIDRNGGPAPDAGGYRTLVLHDPTRLAATTTADAVSLARLESNLTDYVARREVAGKVVDLGAYPHLVALHQQADDNTACPYAENLLAGAIKDLVDGYRALNPDLEFITIVGSDAQVPFFRYPDQALLGPEQNYEPPVADQTQSQSALRRNFILGQDEYGASRTLNLAAGRFPLPELAVGRLVETPDEMSTVLEAYLGTSAGVVATPASTLVTGYDFLTDAAEAVNAELVAGTNATGATAARNDTLITAADISPDDPRSWNADQLRTELLGEGEDIVFLAGHFSANSALAADYETSALATELAASDVDLTNSIVFSAGCHSGYNIVDGDAIPFLTEPLDWTQAFAQQGATLVAGTGYQYGDTDFVEYSERLYVLFARELRRGAGPVSVGAALSRAKQEYLASTPDVRGLHRKSVIISTVFGLPNLQVDLPGERLPAIPSGSAVSPTPVTAGPGTALGLEVADVDVPVAGQLTGRTVDLANLADPSSPLQAEYLEGPDGVVTHPAEPALPLVRTDVTVAGRSLRGVGFRGGSWSEDVVVPLTGAPTTELRGVHTPFASTVDFPMRLATVNYFGALTGSGRTSLNLTPVQHRVGQIGDVDAIRRTFDDVDLRLFYSGNTTTYGSNRPALSGPPTFAGVQAVRDGDDVLVRTRVVGDPAAGIQSVWVTYTDGSQPTGTWRSVDLQQAADDSTVWSGRITGGATLGRLDFVVQAVNGVGLVTLDDNYGAYYRVTGVIDAPPVTTAPTDIVVDAPAHVGFGDVVTVSATLTSTAAPVAGAPVLFTLGGSARVGVTDAAGVATADLPITAVPGSYSLVAAYAGTASLDASSASATIGVEPAATSMTLTLRAEDGRLGAEARLTDASGAPLLQRTVVVTLLGPGGTQQVARITDNIGRVRFGPSELDGVHVVTASFAGDDVYLSSAATGSAIVGDALTVPIEPVRIDTAVDLAVAVPDGGIGGVMSVDWGDGVVLPLGTATASHLYGAAGVYQITVTLTDDAGRVSSVVSDYVVVYDPSAGYVTGVGVVPSPRGAYVDRPSATGLAAFGLVSRYAPGFERPRGDTDFFFLAGRFYFESTDLAWLVVNGSDAQYRGTGRVNGRGSYDFVVTVRDDGRDDTFRFQVLDPADGRTVYDTLLGENVVGTGVDVWFGGIQIRTPSYQLSRYCFPR